MQEDDLQNIDLDAEIDQLETKAQILNSQQEKYAEFSKLVLNSFKLMEQKFNEMQVKLDLAFTKNKENINQRSQPTSVKKSVSVGKVSVKQIIRPKISKLSTKK